MEMRLHRRIWLENPEKLPYINDGPHEMGALVPGIVVERKIPGRRQVFPGGGSLAFRRRQAAGSIRRVRNNGVITIVVHALHQGKGVACCFQADNFVG